VNISPKPASGPIQAESQAARAPHPFLIQRAMSWARLLTEK
jgi:hypothetical protein